MKTITHDKWIACLEHLYFIETKNQAQEGNPKFEEWLNRKSVESLLAYLKKIEK